MDKSPIITLTTDFGTSDVYIGAMKGVICGINPNAQIVDITHAIPPQDIHEAAFTIQAVQRYFPGGTIHVIVVDPGVGSDRHAIVCRTDRAFFVCPNNGVLSYLLQDILTEGVCMPDAVVIENPAYLLPQISNTFHGRDIFAPIAAHLSLGVPLAQIGTPITDLIRLPLRTSQRANKALTGEIIKVDSFGNLITNISKDVLTSFLLSSKIFEIRVGRTRLKKLNSSYAESESGEPLAIIGSFGLLEIAINMGNAATHLGIKKGDGVIVQRLD